MSDICLLLVCLLSVSACHVHGNVVNLSMINVQKANQGQFPYVISLKVIGHEHYCGGGIIGEQFILTAAHCVIQDNDKFFPWRLAIVAGTDNFRKLSSTAEIIEVQRIYVPAEFSSAIGGNDDIAVLRLERPLKFSREVWRLRLPTNKKDTYTNRTAMFAGFGWDYVREEHGKLRGGFSDNHLRFSEARVLSPEECRRNQNDTGLSDKKLCAQVRQRNATHPSGVCKADSGGPLVVDGNLVIGILSESEKACTEQHYSAVYTRVSHYLKFIRNAFKNKVTENMRAYP